MFPGRNFYFAASHPVCFLRFSHQVRFSFFLDLPMGDPAKTLFEVLTQEMRLRNYSHKTIKAYKSCIRSFVDHYAPHHPRELTNEDIRCYLLHLRERTSHIFGKCAMRALRASTRKRARSHALTHFPCPVSRHYSRKRRSQ